MKTKTRARKPPGSAALPPLPADAVLMAIDCSSTAIGWAVYRRRVLMAASLARSPASWDSIRRIRANTAEVLEAAAERGVTHAILEWQSPWRAARLRNANGLAVLGQAQGYLLAAIEREFRQIKVDLVSEREWTRVGGWPASKQSRAARVRLLVPEYREAVGANPSIDPGLDIADSLGLALWRLSR